MKKVLFFIFLSFISVNVVNADCTDYEELANNIDFSVMNYYTGSDMNSQIIVTNLREDMYLKVRNNYNDDEDTYTYSDIKQGVITIKSKAISKKINYEIKVYTTDSSCPNTVIRTVNKSTDRFNPYINNSLCVGYYASIKYCGAFYDVKDMSPEEFASKVTEEIKKINDSKMTTLDYVKKYCLFVIVPVLIIIFIYIIKIIILKRRKKQYV